MSPGYFSGPTGTPTQAGRMVVIEEDLPRLELAPGLVAHALLGSDLLVSFVRYEPNSTAPIHAHEEEQVFFVLEGELEMTLGEEVRMMRPGDAALIPAWVPHGVRSLDKGAYQVDVFNPPRKAFLELLAARDAQAPQGR